ncbi:MAG: DNA replication and repair protein RecF, partial [Myxococcales bacterium]|nr:DNA replication and repair protein RecF [Myxococcales bacterium]
KIVAARRRYLAQLLPRFEDAFARIAHSGVRGTLSYRTDEALVEAGDVVATLKEGLHGALTRARRIDLARKTSTVGPHTDDLAFLIDDKPARQFGSQGQVRSLVLAFRISQILDSYDKLKHYPVLLLDDVSSELDARRNAYLFEFLREITCQVFITTTRPELIAVGENRQDFQVVRGVISP